MNTPPEPSLLAQLLGEMPVADFFAQHWQQTPVHLPAPAGQRQRFAALFDQAAFEHAIRHCADLKLSFRNAEGVPMERRCLPDQVWAAFRAGATVCVSDIQDNPALNAFMAAFAREVHQAGELSFNCYCSPDRHGFALHLDDHPVWILQIEGEKRWWYSKTPHHNPLSTISFSQHQTSASVAWADPVPRPDESDFIETVLAPGDVLYLPEGTWHRAAAQQRSLALTLACSRVSPLDVVQHLIGPHVAHHRLLRMNLPGAWAAQVGDTIPPALEVQYQEALEELRALLATLTPQDMHKAWRTLAAKPDAGMPR